MAKYLFTGNYSSDGAKGLLSSSGTERKAQIGKLVSASGGTLECFYFAFGGDDIYAICDLPDAATAAALSLKVGASGAASVRTVVLLEPEVIDAACGNALEYVPPGG